MEDNRRLRFLWTPARCQAGLSRGARRCPRRGAIAPESAVSERPAYSVDQVSTRGVSPPPVHTHKHTYTVILQNLVSCGISDQ